MLSAASAFFLSVNYHRDEVGRDEGPARELLIRTACGLRRCGAATGTT
jgi:hypothetical protein